MIEKYTKQLKTLNLINCNELNHWNTFFSKNFKITNKSKRLIIVKDEDTLKEENHKFINFIPNLKWCNLFNNKFETNNFLKNNDFDIKKIVKFEKPFFTYKKIITKPCNSTGRYDFRIWEKGTLVETKVENLVQDFLEGDEYNLDILKDKKNNVYVCAKKKLLIKAGTTFKCELSNDPKLIDLGKKLASLIPYVGNIDVDVIISNNKYYIIDINPRLGGGFLHSVNLDINFKRNAINIFNNLNIVHKINNIYFNTKSQIEYNFIKI